MRMFHPKLEHTADEPVEVTEREFDSVWKHRGWEKVDDQAAPADDDERAPLDDKYDGMDLDELKAEATLRQIDYPSNIGVDKLRDKLRAADDADDGNPTE